VALSSKTLRAVGAQGFRFLATRQKFYAMRIASQFLGF
jgi:hypothetical protein